MNTNTLQQVIEILAKEGLTDEQIADFCADIAKAAYMHVHAKAVEVLSIEELDRIEALDDAEVETEVKKLFKEKTGVDPQVEIDSFLAKFSQGFVEAYDKKQKSAAANEADEFEKKKKEIELELAKTILTLVEAQKITFAQSQEIARYILSRMEEVRTIQDLILLLSEVSGKWEGFKEIYELRSMRVGDTMQTKEKLEEVKSQLISMMGNK